jgi:hypothetical protein
VRHSASASACHPRAWRIGRPLRVERGRVRAAPSRGIEVGERLGEAVESASRPGPGQQGCAVLGRVPDEVLGQLGRPFVVGNTGLDVSAQQEQVDQHRPVRGGRSAG